jgi:hypothetical protein
VAGPRDRDPGTRPPAVKDDAAPDLFEDEPTNPVAQKPLEQVGEYKIKGEKSFDPKTKIFSREIEGLYGDKGRITDTGPIRKLFAEFQKEAKLAGAKELQITGEIVRNQNIMRLHRVIELLGGKVETIDGQTIVFKIPIK